MLGNLELPSDFVGFSSERTVLRLPLELEKRMVQHWTYFYGQNFITYCDFSHLARNLTNFPIDNGFMCP